MRKSFDDVVLARVRELAATLGTHKQGAEKTGIPYATFQRIIAGQSPLTIERLELFAEAANISVEELTGDGSRRDKRPAYHSAGDVRPVGGDDVELDEIDVAYGLGATFVDAPVATRRVTFSRSWLRHFTDSSPEYLFVATGIGDSMYPTIHTKDVVIVDRSDNTPRVGDQLWALAYGDVGMIKRLRPMPDGSLKMLSDNPSVPPEIAYDGEAHIIGRRVVVARKV